jgi:tRNA(fMet)-specific endonuclease VapC
MTKLPLRGTLLIARLAGRGRTPSFAEGQIAAVAQTNQLVLVTFNTTDYADFAGLTIEDWRQ